MTVHVRMFAVLRDRAGVSEAKIEMAKGATVAQAVDAIKDAFPSLSDQLKQIAVAVNREYVQLETLLHDNDELALIPPVSGG